MEPVLMISPGAPPAIIRGAKICAPRITDHAKHVDADDAVPTRHDVENAAAGLHSGVVDQHMHRAKGDMRAVGQGAQGGRVAQVGFLSDHIGFGST